MVCYSRFFLLRGREAGLPVQRYLDESLRLLESRRWLSQLWRARVNVYGHARHAAERKERLESSNALLPALTLVGVRLNSPDSAVYSNRRGPLYPGQWLALEQYTN